MIEGTDYPTGGEPFCRSCEHQLTHCPYRNSASSAFFSGKRAGINCPKPKCDHSSETVLTLVIKRNYQCQYVINCGRCGKPFESIKTDRAHKLAADGMKVAWVTGIDQLEACIVRGCTEKGYELHHFAPSNVFGDDAGLWPVAPLCPSHHNEWHARMDGYQRYAKGPR